MKLLRSVLPHMLIILAGIFMVFLVLDEYNPTMQFVSNPVSLKLFWGFCVLSVLHSIIVIGSNRKVWKENNKKEME